MRAKLIITVDYDMGETVTQEVVSQLKKAADILAGEGLLSGDLDATVDTWKAEVEVKE